MYEKSWMKFEQSGRIEDYLEYCAKSRKETAGCVSGMHSFETDRQCKVNATAGTGMMPDTEHKNKGGITDGAKLHAHRYGTDIHAGGRV